MVKVEGLIHSSGYSSKGEGHGRTEVLVKARDDQELPQGTNKFRNDHNWITGKRGCLFDPEVLLVWADSSRKFELAGAIIRSGDYGSSHYWSLVRGDSTTWYDLRRSKGKHRKDQQYRSSQYCGDPLRVPEFEDDR